MLCCRKRWKNATRWWWRLCQGRVKRVKEGIWRKGSLSAFSVAETTWWKGRLAVIVRVMRRWRKVEAKISFCWSIQTQIFSPFLASCYLFIILFLQFQLSHFYFLHRFTFVFCETKNIIVIYFILFSHVVIILCLSKTTFLIFIHQ